MIKGQSVYQLSFHEIVRDTWTIVYKSFDAKWGQKMSVDIGMTLIGLDISSGNELVKFPLNDLQFPRFINLFTHLLGMGQYINKKWQPGRIDHQYIHSNQNWS